MKQVLRAIALLASICVWLGLGVSAAAAPAPHISWSKCYASFGPFECGTVQVPLDYGQPKGAAISLAVVRLPATDPQHRIGSLLLNPGGPGGSGVDFTLFAGPFLYNADVRARLTSWASTRGGRIEAPRSDASERPNNGVRTSRHSLSR